MLSSFEGEKKSFVFFWGLVIRVFVYTLGIIFI